MMIPPIYKPKGKAAEYSHLALTVYGGDCGHECTYCCIRRMNQRFKRSAAPHIIPGLFRAFCKQLETFKPDNRRVLLSFSSDPYQPLDKIEGMTRSILWMLSRQNIAFQVLTKSVSAVHDLDLYMPCDAFATTLTFLDSRWKDFEPKASSPQERIVALDKAHRLGIETWVSLEPVLDDEETLRIIRETYTLVDLYKIGILNYGQPPKPISWRRFGIKAIDLCEKFGKPYFIKKDLARHLTGFPFTNTDNRCYDWTK